jgi:hypothetical protein
MKSKNASEPHVDIAGTKRWWSDGKLHREDGPAVVWVDGSSGWFLDGKQHREDGPAVDYPGGAKHWWYDGRNLGLNSDGFWAHWELLTHQQRCNLNLHSWLVKYT